MFGILNLNKPAGMTSRDAVNRVVRLVRPAKAGHAGTLDPLATGVLVVCVGPATRLIEYVQRMPKRYLAAFLLGRESPTEDVESEVTLHADPPQPSLEDIAVHAQALTGRIEQRPPSFSAVKVAGRRAYALARRGQHFELPARPVMVHRIAVTQYEYPLLELDIECGSGTYIRSLGRDLAGSLGTAAVMSGLVRAQVGPFRIEDACRVDELTLEFLPRILIPPHSALEGLPAVRLNESEVQRLSQGLSIAREPAEPSAEFAAFDEQGRLVAILRRGRCAELTPAKNLR
jgi:tRNA pseudouridine55 synthase